MIFSTTRPVLQMNREHSLFEILFLAGLWIINKADPTFLRGQFRPLLRAPQGSSQGISINAVGMARTPYCLRVSLIGIFVLCSLFSICTSVKHCIKAKTYGHHSRPCFLPQPIMKQMFLNDIFRGAFWTKS